jgi:hypothetical protein
MMVTLPKFPVEGGCQCGAVRYALSEGPLAVYNCHCKDCQRFSGGTNTMSMVVRKETVSLLQGQPRGSEKVAASGRIAIMMRCPDCGTLLWNEPLSAADLRILKPGTLDDMSWAVPVGNIWTASRAPWVEIDPALINFEGQPPSREVFYPAWATLVGEGRR